MGVFRKETTLFCVSLLGLLGAWLGYLSVQDPIHKARRHKACFLQGMDTQVRLGVRKDVWVSSKEGERLHDCIEAERSVLSFLPEGGALRTVEKLYGLHCVLEEPAEKKEQHQVRMFKAREGIYDYQSKALQARHVVLSLYKWCGGIPFSQAIRLSSPVFQGEAESVIVSLEKGNTKLEAVNLQAATRSSL